MLSKSGTTHKWCPTLSERGTAVTKIRTASPKADQKLHIWPGKSNFHHKGQNLVQSSPKLIIAKRSHSYNLLMSSCRGRTVANVDTTPLHTGICKCCNKKWFILLMISAYSYGTECQTYCSKCFSKYRVRKKMLCTDGRTGSCWFCPGNLVEAGSITRAYISTSTLLVLSCSNTGAAQISNNTTTNQSLNYGVPLGPAWFRFGEITLALTGHRTQPLEFVTYQQSGWLSRWRGTTRIANKVSMSSETVSNDASTMH